ncbi:hypothetical protein ACH50O_15295 [Methylomonas sp. 2BW1-5-20]
MAAVIFAHNHPREGVVVS